MAGTLRSGGKLSVRKRMFSLGDAMIEPALEKDQRLKVICGILTSVAAIFSPASPLP